MPTAEKEQLVRELATRLGAAKSLYLADFTGMTVEKVSLLRKRCRDSQVQVKVVKNTLLKRAMDERGYGALDDFLAGPTALAFSRIDEVAPAKVLADFAKEFEAPRIKAAWVDGKVLDAQAVKQLASLPSREVMLGLVLGTLVAPLTRLLGAIEATLRLPAVMADVLERERQKG
jgi:large subunit ribosomal protein L10